MRRTLIVVLLSAIVLLCLGALLLETQTHLVRRAIDDLVYDNRNHYLLCEKLPDEGEVRRVLAEQQDTLRLIEQVNPGLVGIDVGAPCPGKADLLIWYASHQDRLAIESILVAATGASAGDTFFGIPYRMQNR